jgi:hypothetical protein
VSERGGEEDLLVKGEGRGDMGDMGERGELQAASLPPRKSNLLKGHSLEKNTFIKGL